MIGKGGVDMAAAHPTLPRWACQNCRHALCVVGTEPVVEKFFNDPARSGIMQASSVQGSVMGASRMDNSFVVLSKQNKLTGPGLPPHPIRHEMSRPMEESFVVLPPPDASTYTNVNNNNNNNNNNNKSNLNQGNTNNSNNNGNNNNNNNNNNKTGFYASVMVLKHAYEIATSQTQIEQPLCLECMRILSDKLNKEVEDVNRDIQAYESCLESLEREPSNVLSESEFLKEKEKIENEERKLQAAIEEAEKQHLEVDSEIKELEIKSNLFDDLEERYWHDFNNFQFQLTSHQEERDGILAKIEVSQAHLELLKRTNVLNNAFFISHDGEFGTINNFRLGRLPKQMVEWDEVNAAWGQACLLLHTMAQFFRPKFSYRIKIIPLGSYPRITDTSGNTYDLFGPVNIFWSTRYDKAMTLFLTCLKEFSEFANFKDQENNVPIEKCFKLPYKIENDKVESYTITQSFNKLENWTKALKYMLCNLKWVLYWFVSNTNFQPLSSASSSQSDLMKN